MTNKIKHHGKKHFCQYCLQCFSRSKVLECHMKSSLVTNHTKLVLLPGKDIYINLIHRLIKTPFMILNAYY